MRVFWNTAHVPTGLELFDYTLPPERIAQSPAPQRTASRLLHLDGNSTLHDRQFGDLPTLLRPHDLLVFNDTRVIKARLTGHKDSGGRVEILVERITTPCRALAHVKASKSPKPGTTLLLANAAVRAQVGARQGALFELLFPDPVLPLLERYGTTPLPPYIGRAPDTNDEARYQTVYARAPGAVAAPTAGLHFDDALLHRLDAMGVTLATLTLHVGAGTFQPVRGRLSEHVMHAERFLVPEATLRQAQAARAAGGRVIAVGTTSVRALESTPDQSTTRNPAGVEGDTRLFITPGYRFHWVDALITNFHLPQSTLLMLVCAFAGTEPVRRAYAHAIQAQYRFFSYGDAMFIEPPRSDRPTQALDT